MGKVVKVTEENEKLTLRYTKRFDYWNLLWTLLFLGFTSFIIDIDLGLACFIGAMVIIPNSLQKDREINLTIDEHFIHIEYPSTNDKDTIKKMFANKNIKRIYAVNRDKNVQFFKNSGYELWIENYKGERTKILGKKEGFVIKKEKDIFEALEEIRQFLGMNNYLKSKKEETLPVKASQIEISNRIPTKAFVSPREVNKEQDTAKLKIQDLREGVLFDFYNENWEVIGQVQHDWKSGNTDTLYQIKNQRNQISLLFVAQNMAVYTAWIEERVPQYELINSSLDKISQNLPTQFIFRGSLFLKEHFNTGHEFVSKSKNGVKIKQWKYLSEDRKESLRILEHEDKDTFVFWGERIEEFEFSNILSS
jgi:hypothetical protein